MIIVNHATQPQKGEVRESEVQLDERGISAVQVLFLLPDAILGGVKLEVNPIRAK